MRVCTNCPSFGPTGDPAQVVYLGRDYGIGMCLRHKKPVDSANITSKNPLKLMEDIAGDCLDHGKERPAPDDSTAITGGNIAFVSAKDVPQRPEPDVTSGYIDPASEAPKSCSACKYSLSPRESLDTFGIPATICTPFGYIIPHGKSSLAAERCVVGVQSFEDHYSENVKRVDLYEYWDGNITVIDSSPVDLFADKVVIDPNEAPTDSEVTEEDKAHGIRAWRRVDDPEDKSGSRFVLMPVFDPEFFSDAERVKIPQTGDDEHPELYSDHQGILYKALTLWRKLGETPALNGISGTGKTEFFRYVAWNMQLPFERISITNSTELDDLAGRTILRKVVVESKKEGEADQVVNETSFQYGRIPKAWAKPCIIVIDEPNVGPPDVWQFIRPLTDNSKQLVLDVNEGERISRHEHCYLGMAFNPAWDVRNVGTHEISDADGSRLMHISVPPPGENKEIEIIVQRCKAEGYEISPEAVKAVMGIAKDLRALAQEDALSIHWGVRNSIKAARATEHFSYSTAFRLAAADFLDPDERDAVMTVVKSHTDGVES
jgi:MoxR-like ATPase